MDGQDDTLQQALLNRQINTGPDNAVTALSKAQTIGAPKLGEHYVTDQYSSPVDKLTEMLVGSGRPRSLQVQDPFGIETALQGKGSLPVMAGTMDEGKQTLLNELRSLSKEKPSVTALVSHLMSFVGNPPNVGIPGTPVSRVPTPSRWPTMLNNTLSRVPEAEGKLTIPDKVVSRAPGLPSAYQAQANFRTLGKLDSEQQLSNNIMKGIYERPSVTDPSQLQDIVSSPTAKTNNVAPSGANGHQLADQKRKLAASGLDEQTIKDIRALPLNTAITLYPKFSKNTLQGIIKGDTFGWVK